ncbi:MAG: hypothetical protein JWM78_559 [Verrucomicrobiaceae bacterium]|nr:hypothetical protein [Verrucomicrobiaceae bacterium]
MTANATITVDSFRIIISGATNTGHVRGHNEDAILTDNARGLAVVADGMGGHATGEVASRITIDTFAQLTSDAMTLRNILLQAHAAIVAKAIEQPESEGMGATAVAVLADTEHFQIAWVGDSRAYHWRRGQLRQLTRDHSYLEFLLRSGEITEQQALNHPQRNVVTQALGLNSPEPDVINEQWQQGDRLLLCSDGLSDELDANAIERLLSANADTESAVSELIGAALRNGGRDNVSVVLLENRSEKLSEFTGSGRGLLASIGGLTVVIFVVIVWWLRRS